MIRSSLNVAQLIRLRDEDPVGPNSNWNAGFAHDLRQHHAACHQCHGSGQVVTHAIFGFPVNMQACPACGGTGFADRTTHEEWVAHLFFCVVNKLNLHKDDLLAEVTLLKDRLGPVPHS